jgi:hypothetical protein
MFRTFPKAQNGGKKERLHCASLQPDFEHKNRHVILKTRNKYSQKVQEIVLYKSLSLNCIVQEFEFELPLVRTERFKSSFVNRCLFNFV